jgi:hypothetical protein
MIVSRTGEVYHLGTITAHEKVIEHFKLKDGDKNHIARVEISPRVDGEYLKPITAIDWKFRLDEEEKPSWWETNTDTKCWEAFIAWMKSTEGRDFKRKYKRIQKWANEMKSKTGEQLVYAEKLTPSVRKLIISYYKEGDSKYWDSVRGSVWYSVWGSVCDSSVRGSVWYSVMDSVWNSVWNSVWYSVRDSVRDSVLYSLGSYLGNEETIKLKLPADIFKAGVVHAKINDEIWVWGKKGKLLGKIEMKVN